MTDYISTLKYKCTNHGTNSSWTIKRKRARLGVFRNVMMYGEGYWLNLLLILHFLFAAEKYKMEKRLNKNRYETSWNDLRDMWQREVVKKRDMWQNQRASPKTYDLIKNEQNLALYQLIKHKFVMINQIKPTQHLNILSNLFQIKMFLFNKMNKIQFRALFTRWKEMYLYIMKHATEFI